MQPIADPLPFVVILVFCAQNTMWAEPNNLFFSSFNPKAIEMYHYIYTNFKGIA